MMICVMFLGIWILVKLEVRNMKLGEKILGDGTILQVRISHKGKRDIPKGTFKEMLRQAGIDEKTFRELLGR